MKEGCDTLTHSLRGVCVTCFGGDNGRERLANFPSHFPLWGACFLATIISTAAPGSIPRIKSARKWTAIHSVVDHVEVSGSVCGRPGLGAIKERDSGMTQVGGIYLYFEFISGGRGRVEIKIPAPERRSRGVGPSAAVFHSIGFKVPALRVPLWDLHHKGAVESVYGGLQKVLRRFRH